MADEFWNAYTAAYDASQKQGASATEALNRLTARKAGSAFASGDYTGASNIFAQSGDINQAASVQQYGAAQKLAQAKAVTEAGLSGISALSQIPEAQRPAYFQSQVAPVLRQHGVPEAQIQQWGSGPMDDAHLQAEGALLGQARQKLEFQKVGESTIGVDPYSGKPVATYMAGQPPASPQATPSTPGAPAPAGPAYAQIGQVAGGLGATPEEIAYLQRAAQIESAGNQAAQNGKSTGIFQFHPDTFARVMPGGNIASPADQTQAALTLARQSSQALQQRQIPVTAANLYIMHQQGAGGGLALLSADPNANAVQALAPAYKGNLAIARRAILGNGGNPNMTAGQFVGMWQQRFGGQPAPAAAPAAPQGVTETSPGVYSVAGAAKPQSAPSGYRYKADGTTLEAIPGGPADANAKAAEVDPTGGALLAHPDMHGPQFLTTLPKATQPIVKALAEGRMQFPSSFALAKPYWQSMIQAVGQYDPSFDTANPSARSKTRSAFTSGQQAQQITSYNTALGHLDAMDRAIDGLGNSGFSWFNAPSQAFAQASGDTRVQAALADFNTVKGAVSSELVKALRGSGGAEADVKYWQKQFDAASSPDALHATVKEAAGLLASRIDALTQTYNTGMGTTATTVPGLTPKAQSVLARLGGETPHAAPQGGVQVLTPQQAARLPKGAHFRTTDGRDMIRQ